MGKPGTEVPGNRNNAGRVPPGRHDFNPRTSPSVSIVKSPTEPCEIIAEQYFCGGYYFLRFLDGDSSTVYRLDCIV